MKKRQLKRCIIVVCTIAVAVVSVFVIKKLQYKQYIVSAVDELYDQEGTYDECSIVLNNTTRGRAQKIADAIGADLRITSDGSFATLTLTDGRTISDIYNNPEYEKYIKDFSADYHANVSDLDESEDTHVACAPKYSVSDTGYKYQSYLNYINLSDSWTKYKGTERVIAIIDTGIDTDHPEFTNRISEKSYNATTDKVLENEQDWSIIEDEQGHGTAVAGVVAASMDSNGIVGVAPEVSLLIIKCECDAYGAFLRTSDLVFGLYYAIEQNADIVNMSFGTSKNYFSEAALLAADSDVICVAAAGNSSSSFPEYPAADPNVIGIGALDAESWTLASYSNFGENVDIVAPGTVYTAKIGGEYDTIHGTSFSAPVVAGALVLYKEKYPYCTLDSLQEDLYASCVDLGDLGYDYYYGYGALDVSALLSSERGTVTYNYLTDEIDTETQKFVLGRALQQLPEPERVYCVFDGWYYDAYCTEEVQYYEDAWGQDITIYAKWCNEDDCIPYEVKELSDTTVEITSYTGHRRHITIPSLIDGKKVVSIGSGAFADQTNLRTVNLPDTVTLICEDAFRNCTNILSIKIPKSVVSIGSGAFCGCVRLSGLEIENESSLVTIGSNAFTYTALREFILPEELSDVDGSAFFGTRQMLKFTVKQGNSDFASLNGVLFSFSGEEIVAYPAGKSGEYSIPNLVKKIGTSAFSYSLLTDLNLNNVTTIGDSAFAYSNLESIDINDSITELGANAFEGCLHLNNVQIGCGLTNISEFVFRGCSELKQITIPNSITKIGYAAFMQTGLTSVIFEDNSTLIEIGGAAFAISKLISVNIPKSVVIVGNDAFKNIKLLSTVTFENESALSTIGQEAFANDISLTTINLPDKLYAIGESAFSNTTSLNTIVFPNSLTYLGSYAFIDSGLDGVINIPASLTSIEINPFASCQNLDGISVDTQNPVFKDFDGVLYSKYKTSYQMNGTTVAPVGYSLISYPAGKDITSYSVIAKTDMIECASFYGAKKLTNIVLNQELTEIHEYAFYKASSVQSMAIPNNVIQISRYAFAGTSSLSSITFDSNNSKIYRIGFAAFAESGITSFIVPQNVSSLSQKAFNDCSKLTSIIFAQNSKLKYISAYQFAGCDSLSSITFAEGSSLTNIEAHAFEDMPKLVTVAFGNAQIYRIGNYAFRYCPKLTNISIPEGVTYIGRFAFYGDSSLSQITIPTTVDYIGSHAFYSKAQVTNVCFAANYLPANVQESWEEGIKGYYIGTTQIEESGDWKYTKSGQSISIVEYSGSNTSVDLTSLDFGGDIISIGGDAFKGSSVETIVLPSTLLTIQRSAFAYSAIKNMTIPKTVRFIGAHAFDGCENLLTVTFETDSNLETIEKYAFANTTKVQEISLPASIQTIGSYVFYNSGISSIAFADGILVSEIPQSAFECTKLTSVTIPNSVKAIRNDAFANIQSLASVNFGIQTELILESRAFYNTGITNLYIPANVTYIGESSLVGLYNLTAYEVAADNEHYKSIDGVLFSKDGKQLIAFPGGKNGTYSIPDTVEIIGFGAFENSSISTINFADNSRVSTIGFRAFYNADGLVTITIPDSVVSIDYSAFSMSDNLEIVEFSGSSKLTGIYEGAFYGCKSLENILLPDSLIEISDYAFYGCRKIDSIPVSDDSQLSGIFDYAFAYSGLEGELVIDENILDIGDYAFLGTDITSVSISSENYLDIVIGIGAFRDCAQLKSVDLPFIGASYLSSNNWFGYIFGAGNYAANYLFVPESLTDISIVYGPKEIKGGIAWGETIYNGTFGNHRNIVNLSIAEDTTSITSTSFSDCTELVTISLPDSITSIPDSAFKNDEKLNAFVVPEQVETIGSYAFYGCKSLESVVFSGELGTIGEFAFCGCDGLVSINLPDSITAIGTYAFGGCDSLCILNLPNSLNCIPAYLCASCESLEEVNVGNNTKSVGQYAFYWCESLNQINLPDGLEEITRGAFENCSHMSYVDIPAGTTFNKNNFCYFSGIKYITYGDQLLHADNGTIDKIYKAVVSGTAIDYYDGDALIFEQENGFIYEVSSSAIKLVAYVGNSGSITLPTTYHGQCYTIDNFVGTMDEITIPDGVTTIISNAFSNCFNVKKITVPESVTKFEAHSLPESNNLNIVFENSDAFVADNQGLILDYNNKTIAYAYSNIKDVVIPDGIETIPASLFANSKIQSVVLGKDVLRIEHDAFYKCENLESVTFNQKLKFIGYWTFAGCKKLKSVVLPNSLTWLGSSAFQWAGLENVVLSTSLTEITDQCFSQTNIKTLQLHEGITKIGDSAFWRSDLSSITIPSTVTSHGYGVFSECVVRHIVNKSDLILDFDDTWGASGVSSITDKNGNTSYNFKEIITDDGFVFIERDNEYTLMSYTGAKTMIELPLTYNDKSYSVYQYFSAPNVKVIYVPDGFTSQLTMSSEKNILKIMLLPENYYSYSKGYYRVSSENIPKQIEGAQFYQKDSTYYFVKDDFMYKYDENQSVLMAYLGSEDSIKLPDDIGGEAYCISTLVNSIFDVNEIEIDSENIIISKYAFSASANLENVVIKACNPKIEDYAFNNCYSLASISLPGNIQSVAQGFAHGTKYLSDEHNYTNGLLKSGNVIVAVSSKAKYLGNVDGYIFAYDAFNKAYSLRSIDDSISANYNLYELYGLNTVIRNYHAGYVLSAFNMNTEKIPVELEKFVLKNVEYNVNKNYFYGIEGVTIFVDEYEENIMWDHDAPNWNNGNKVYYKGDWIQVNFCDKDGNIIDSQYYTTSQIIKQPYVDPIEQSNTTLVFDGWDINNDGQVDMIPAMSSTDITAKAIMKQISTQYTIDYYGYDNELVYERVYAPGETIATETDLVKTGYTFKGWDNAQFGEQATKSMKVHSLWEHVGNGHIFESTNVSSTCTERGYIEYVCTLCGYSYKVMNSELPSGHKFGDLIVDDNPTCTTEGHGHRVCSECNAISESESIPCIEHSCSSCITKNATCTEPGIKKYTCSQCNKTFEETIPATEHHYVKCTKNMNLFKWLNNVMLKLIFGRDFDSNYCYVCTECGDIMMKDDLGSHVHSASVQSVECSHPSGTWIVLNEETETSQRVEGYKCNLCGEYTKLAVGTHNAGIIIDLTVGDVDGDSLITVKDASKLLYIVVDLDDAVDDERVLDVNKDGRVDVLDVSTLLRYLGGYITTLN